MKIFHKRYGNGVVISFHPLMYIGVVFKGNRRVFSTAKRNTDEMTVDGKSLTEIVCRERKNFRWHDVPLNSPVVFRTIWKKGRK